MNTPRHAYLIAAHGSLDQLKSLLSLLDVPENDIYLHIDKKAKSFRQKDFSDVLSLAGIHFVPRRSSGWGSPRFIDVILSLLREATKTEHQYYHLLSGADLPLKTQPEIHAFFSEHAGKEFINYQHPAADPAMLHYRLGIYHPLFSLGKKTRFIVYGERALEKLQRGLRVNRLRRCPFRFQKGHLWFSVTHALACYMLQQAPLYRPYFRQSFCGDELFFHSIVVNSPFDAARYMPGAYDDTRAILRYIDWPRGSGGSPYTFTLADYDALTGVPHLFARKFDAKRDPVLFEKRLSRLNPAVPNTGSQASRF